MRAQCRLARDVFDRRIVLTSNTVPDLTFGSGEYVEHNKQSRLVPAIAASAIIENSLPHLESTLKCRCTGHGYPPPFCPGLVSPMMLVRAVIADTKEAGILFGWQQKNAGCRKW
jgi:hypothetical protein